MPDYIFHKPSGPYFRYRFPKDIAPLVGKTELRYSLKTSSIRLAKARARAIAGQLQLMITDIREGDDMAELQPEHINGLIQKYVREALEEDERWRVMRKKPLTPTQVNGVKKTMVDCGKFLQGNLAMLDHRFVKPVVDNLLETEGLTASPDSFVYLQLSREVLKASVELMKVYGHRNRGDYSKEPVIQPVSVPRSSAMPSPSVSATSTMRVSELIRRYLAEGEKEERWTDKTLQEVESSIQRFTEIMGDLPVDTVDHVKANEYKDKAMRLPPNLKKNKALQGLSMAQILKMEHEKTLSVRSVNKLITRIGAVFDYGVRHGYMKVNPMDGLSLTDKKARKDKRERFMPEDLPKIFSSPEYQDDTFPSSYCYWMPLLGLYTGARINELAQLYLSDSPCVRIVVASFDQSSYSRGARMRLSVEPLLSRRTEVIPDPENAAAREHVGSPHFQRNGNHRGDALQMA